MALCARSNEKAVYMVKDAFQKDLSELKNEISRSIDKALEEKDDAIILACLRESWTTVDIVLDMYNRFKETK